MASVVSFPAVCQPICTSTTYFTHISTLGSGLPAWEVTPVTQSARFMRSSQPIAVTDSTFSGREDTDISYSYANKKGLAFNDPNLANIFKTACPSCTWAYNWDSSAPGLTDELNYVPMLRSPSDIHLKKWNSAAGAAITNGAKALFSFNEPDNAGQANMSPSNADAAHNKHMNGYAGKALIGAPAVTNSNKIGEGIQWLKHFMSACSTLPGGCHVDFCSVHWYSEVQYAHTLFDHLAEAHEACGGKPVWLTEFGAFGSGDDIVNFMATVIPKLDSLVYLHKFSYFMVSVDNLMSSPASLSKIGQAYARA